jgi:hypothetical protein
LEHVHNFQLLFSAGAQHLSKQQGFYLTFDQLVNAKIHWFPFDQGMVAWRLTFVKIETFHWTGLALSASTDFEPLVGWLLILFTLLQSLLAYGFFYELQ